MSLKLGKLPASPSPLDFALTKVAVDLPPVPVHGFGHGRLFPDWGMLGNDREGDCVWAGGDHETMLWNKLAGHTVLFTDENALSDYHACTGPGDNGTDVRQAMAYRLKTGLIDSLGQRHKIDAYLSIDAKDWDLMLRCVYTFGAVGIGFEFPDYAMKQFDDNEPWEYLPTGQIEGGHYVCCVGSYVPHRDVTVVTWARRQRMAKDFYEHYNDETWVPLSFELMKKTGYGLHNVSREKLQALFDSLPR